MKVGRLPYSIYKSTMPHLSLTGWLSTLPRSVQNSSCGPTAAANIIYYLATHNCCRLIPPQGDLTLTHVQTKLIDTLARYMDTYKDGTGASDMIHGLENYVVNRGYNISIKWVGEPYTGKYKCGSVPTPNWIMRKTMNPYNTILWLGQYNHNEKKELYRRNKGHAVAVAGFNSVYNELLIHDSARYKAPVTCELYKLAPGRLTSKNTTKHSQASDFSELYEVYPYEHEESYINVIEGALSFKVYPR